MLFVERVAYQVGERVNEGRKRAGNAIFAVAEAISRAEVDAWRKVIDTGLAIAGCGCTSIYARFCHRMSCKCSCHLVPRP